MACVNVNRSLSDQFYRYKMPKLLAKVEGKGNGIKTVIVNMVDIAKSLNRPPMYPTKYFGCVLGAQVNYDPKNERYIVNGSHESNKLQDLLDGFIQKYVLCPSCHNPETVLGVLTKKNIITTSCKACGYNGLLNNKDKLTTYILKNPPTAVSGNGAGGKESKKNKKSKKEEKNGKKHANGDSNSPGAAGDSDEKDDPIDNLGNGNDDDDDETWGENTDPDAVAKRMSELSLGAKNLMMNEDLEKSPKERLDMFLDYVKNKKTECGGVFDANAQKDIVAEAERLDIRDKAVLVLCELLFDEDIIQQIKTHRVLFLRFTAENVKAQRYLMRGFEQVVQRSKSELLPKVSRILKAFYDSDILDEKVIIDWGSKASKKIVGEKLSKEIHEKAQLFLTWLKEAEEEESESEEEEAEIEVVYDDRVRDGEVQVEVEKAKPPPVFTAVAPALKEEIDIDIDAI